MSKVITLTLTDKGINQALKDIEAYKKEVEEKTKRLRIEVAKKLKERIERIVSMSMVDEHIHGGYKTPNATVDYRDEGANVTIVYTKGSDIVWIEFGAGVHFNRGGGNRSPYASKVPGIVGIGEYGKGHGKQDTWVFSEGGEKYWTYGTKATAPMYNAMKNIEREIESIAKEVFK